MLSFALRRKSGESPSAPPIDENSVGDLLVPPAAKMPGKGGAVDIVAALVERHQADFSGIAAEIAAASSAIRVAASRARLSGIS